MIGALIGSLLAALIDKLPAIEAEIGHVAMLRELGILANSLADAALAVANYRERLKALTDDNDKRIRAAEDKLREGEDGKKEG